MTPSVANLVACSVQLAVLVVAALAITSALRLRVPRAALHFWQMVLAAGILLPLVQPRVESSLVALATSPIVASVSERATAFTQRVDIVSWLAAVLALGAAARLGWLAVGLVRLRGILATATPAAALQPLVDSLSQSINASAAITLSDDVPAPATIGVRRPVILLPRRILGMPQPVQRAVIAHELMHVRRRDWLQTMFEELWCAVWWFHPAARLLVNRLAVSREMVVDEATLRLTRDRRAYAEALLAFANPHPHLPGVTPLIGRRHLSQRISLIAKEEIMSRPRVLSSLAIALLVVATATASAVSALPMSVVAGQDTRVYKPGDGVSLPSVVYEVKPKYTPEAMKQRIQGSVFMRVVVRESGGVGDVQVTQSLDAEYGLDQEAIKAAKQWIFNPGMKDGKPVAVEVTVQMTFTLKK
jgi:TonB family protein